MKLSRRVRLKIIYRGYLSKKSPINENKIKEYNKCQLLQSLILKLLR